MSLKKLFKGKKKPEKNLGKGLNTSRDSVQSTSSLPLAESTESLGYLLKEKDLPKFLKASWQGDLNKVKSSSSGKKVNWNETDKEHRTALHLACAKGHLDVVEYLLKNNVDVNKRDSEGKTPLMKACEINHIKIVDILLKNGAETNVYDINHMSPMHIAAANGNADIGTYLINRDAKLDSKDMNEVTPLHLSCALGHLSFVEFLVSEYVQINCIDNQKRTPLMAACIDGNLEIVKLLLEQQADPTMTDKNGQTAEALALESKNNAVATFINEFIAKKTTKSPTSQVVSSHGQSPVHELFSPVAKSLNAMFSPSLLGKNDDAPIFGGPVGNSGGLGVTEKSEESRSEDLGGDSWGDTDTESEFDKDKKLTGINISAMMKQKGTPKKQSNANVDNTLSTGNKASPEIATPKKGELSDDETVSEWDDDDDDDDVDDVDGKVKDDDVAKNQFLKGVQDEAVDKAKKTAEKNPSTPPQPADLDASPDSFDFDSSMPEDSFSSELPMSDLEPKSNKNLLTKSAMMEKIKEKQEDGNDDEESVWDSSLPETSQNKEATNKVLGEPNNNAATEKDEVQAPKDLPKDQNNNKNDASDWDTESELPSDDEHQSEPSEEMLPPKTPEPGSEFELSSSNDEESDFSLGELTNKKAVLPKETSSRTALPANIFQTEVVSSNGSKQHDDSMLSESDDNIEQQLMNNLRKTPTTKHPDEESHPAEAEQPKESKTAIKRNKQMADLGFDIGSDISTVSDPEGLSLSVDLPEGFGNDAPDLQASGVNKSDGIGILTNSGGDGDDDDIETESESEWELEQKRKRAEKVAATSSIIKEGAGPGQEVLSEGPVSSLEENLDFVDDDETSSDFSFSDRDITVPGMDTKDDVFEDNAEAVLLKQMEVAEANTQQQKLQDRQKQQQREQQKNPKEKDSQIKAQLQSILDRSKSPEQILKENQHTKEELDRLREEEGKTKLEIQKRRQELSKLEERKLKNLEQKELLHKQRLEKQEEENMLAVREKEIRAKAEYAKEIESQKELAEAEEDRRRKLLEKEIEDRLNALKQEELDRRKAFEEEEENRKQALQDEENARRSALLIEEETKRKELDSYMDKMKNDLKENERAHQDSLQNQEKEMQSQLKLKEQELQRIILEKKNQTKCLEETKIKLEELETQRDSVREGLLKDNEETFEKINLEQQQKMQEMERLAKLKEEELTTRLRELEEEERKMQLKLGDTSALETTYEELQLKNQQFRDQLKNEQETLKDAMRRQLEEEEEERKRKLSDEYHKLYDKLESERRSQLHEVQESVDTERRKRFEDLENEEELRRRKLSEEALLFREALEKERVEKLDQLFNRSEEEKERFLETLGDEQRLKMAQFEKEATEKEKMLMEKLKSKEAEHERELSHKLKQKVLQKLKLMEDEKKSELQQKEDLLTRLQEELSRKTAELDLSKEEGFSQKFHEFEREARKREHELEVQLMELRDKQMRNETHFEQRREQQQQQHQKQQHVLFPVPVDELMITSVQQDAVQSAILDSLDDLSPVEEVATQPATATASFTSPVEEKDASISAPKSRNHIVKEKIENLKRPETSSKKKSARRIFQPLYSDIEPISSSNHNYTFDHGQTTRYLKGASTPKAWTGYSDEAADLYEELQVSHRQIEKLREKECTQERVKRDLELEMDELHRTIESLGQTRNENEKSRLDIDLELQSVKYKLEQESESRLVAERLCTQLKEQLARTETKLIKEAESRQTVDLTCRKTQSELKTKDQRMSKLQEELMELQLVLDTEKDSRALQEQLYQEQLRQHEAILIEAQKTSHNHAQALTKLEVLNESNRKSEATGDMLKMELAKAKGELSRALSQLEEKTLQVERDRETLNEKIQARSDELNAAERKLFQLQLQYDNEKASKQTYETQMSMKLDNEANVRQQLGAEIASLKSQLENANREIDRFGDQKTSSDRAKETFNVEKIHLEKELALTKEHLKTTETKLLETEARLNDLNGELQKTGMALAVRQDEIAGTQKSYADTRNTIEVLEQNLRSEKLNCDKLENKLETSDQKISLLQEECLKLQKELNKAREQQSLIGQEAVRKQESLSSVLSDVKERSQEERGKLIVQNEQANLYVENLRNQMEQKDQQLKDKIAELQQASQELQVTKRSLLHIEGERDRYIKERDGVMNDNTSLRQNVAEAEQEVDNLKRINQGINEKLDSTNSELHKSAQETEATNRKLNVQSDDIDKLKAANFELNRTLHDIKQQNFQIEADLRQEKSKAEVLLVDLGNANEARESLEALLSNIKSNNIILEEKLHSETLHRSQREREVEEHKGLWESEVKSRSKLGVQFLDMEKKIEGLKQQLEEEKRKTRKFAQVKKTAENKVEMFEQRKDQHQKEVNSLRNKLKQYQKKLKSLENAGPSPLVEYEKDKMLTATTVQKLRRQLDQLSTQLSHEQELKNKAERNEREQMKELTDLKTKEKVKTYELEKLATRNEALEMELKKLKDFYEKNYVAQGNLEEFKQSLETKCRLDLNKKLQEVNMHLEEQALAREAFEKIRNDKEMKTRAEFENTISDLKSDLHQMRTSLHVGLAKRDTSQHEAKRYKDLFVTECTSNDKLSEKLQKTTDLLSTERNRMDYLVNESSMTKQRFDESPSRTLRSMSPRFTVDDALDFNATSYRPYSTPTAASRSFRLLSPEKDLYSSIKHRNLME